MTSRRIVFSDPHAVRNDQVYRTLPSSAHGSHIACGFWRPATDADLLVEGAWPSYAMVYVLAGTGTCTDADDVTHRLRPGSVLQRLPGRPHRQRMDRSPGWAECWIDLGGALPSALADAGVIDLRRQTLEPGLDQSIPRRLARTLGLMREAREHELPRAYLDLVGVLVDVYALDRGRDAADPHAALLTRACRLLTEGASSREPLERVAATLHLSYQRFRTLFRERIGVSPGEFRIRHRIDRAREMLLGSDRSVKDIARDLGYANPQSFSLQFKALVGRSPEIFRARRHCG